MRGEKGKSSHMTRKQGLVKFLHQELSVNADMKEYDGGRGKCRDKAKRKYRQNINSEGPGFYT